MISSASPVWHGRRDDELGTPPRTPHFGAYLTPSSDRAAEAALILDARVAIPLHFEGWAHFTQGAGQLRVAVAGNGVTERLHLPGGGATIWARTQ